MALSQDHIPIAEVATVHGVRGEVRLRVLVEDDTLLEHPDLVDDRGQKVRLAIRAVTGKGAFIAAIDGVNDRNLAERWRGQRFLLPRSVLPPAEDGEFYVDDLIGLAVYNQAGKEVGVVRLVADFGAGDVVEITFHNGTDGMFAFTHDIFPEVSITEGRLLFVPPPEEEAKP